MLAWTLPGDLTAPARQVSHFLSHPTWHRDRPQRKNLRPRKNGTEARRIAARLAVEEIYNDVSEGADLRPDYVYFILVAAAIAAIGLA